MHIVTEGRLIIRFLWAKVLLLLLHQIRTGDSTSGDIVVLYRSSTSASKLATSCAASSSLSLHSFLRSGRHNSAVSSAALYGALASPQTVLALRRFVSTWGDGQSDQVIIMSLLASDGKEGVGGLGNYDLIYLLLRFCCGGGHIMYSRSDSPDVGHE